MRRKVSKYVLDNILRTKDDFGVDTFRAGGKGGQNQNKVESGVRITDKITGLSSECREERDQLQNKAKAFEKLVEKMIKYYQEQEVKVDYKSDKEVRVYRATDGKVVDHRISTVFRYKDVMEGKINDMLEQVQLSDD